MTVITSKRGEKEQQSQRKTGDNVPSREASGQKWWWWCSCVCAALSTSVTRCEKCPVIQKYKQEASLKMRDYSMHVWERGGASARWRDWNIMLPSRARRKVVLFSCCIKGRTNSDAIGIFNHFIVLGVLLSLCRVYTVIMPIIAADLSYTLSIKVNILMG